MFETFIKILAMIVLIEAMIVLTMITISIFKKEI